MVGPRQSAPGQKSVSDILQVRDLARKDFLFLCREMLGYKDVDEKVHGPILKACMIKWQGAPLGEDRYTGKPPYWFSYRPPSDDLSGCLRPGHDWPRKRLLLVFRSSFKTTLNVICDLIHTHIRFPRLSAQVFHAVEEKSKAIKQEIAKHWTENDAMRYYFPDYCPEPGASGKRKYESGIEFFSTSRISSPSIAPQRKEATVSANALGKASASAHVDLIKFTDIVDPTNSTTEEQCLKVWRFFNMARNLLSDPYKLFDVEGTIYSPFDVYQRLLDLYWENIEPRKRQKIWHITYIPAFCKQNQTFTPDDATKPWALASHDIQLPSGKRILKGEKIPYWPVWRGDQPRLDKEALEEYERDDPEGYAGQMLLLPFTERGSAGFDIRNLRMVPMNAIRQMKFNHKRIVIDTAETQNEQSCKSAILYGEHTETGKVVIRSAKIEKLTPAELLDEIWKLCKRFDPDDVLIEETGYVRGLKLAMEERSRKTGVYPPFVFLKREPGSGKHDRIEGSIGIPWKEKRILISSEEVDELAVQQIKLEASGFRKIKQVDGMDALSDFWHPEHPMDVEGRPEDSASAREMSKREAQAWVEAQWDEMIFGKSPLENNNYGW